MADKNRQSFAERYWSKLVLYMLKVVIRIIGMEDTYYLLEGPRPKIIDLTLGTKDSIGEICPGT